MGEVYGLAALVLGFAGVGWCFVMKLLPGQPKEPEQRGTWRRTQETTTVSTRTLIRILLVREHEGRETGRLLVREISSSAPNWNELYVEAVAEADLRLAALESAERN